MSLFDEDHWVNSHYFLADKVVSICACALSVIGASLVIFSFLCESETGLKWKEVWKLFCGYKFKETITTYDGREKLVTKYKVKSYHYILINLSLADIATATSRIWGLFSDWEQVFSNKTESVAMESNISCTTQAAFIVTFSLSSFFWTDILAIFLAFNIVFKHCSNNHVTGQNAPDHNAHAYQIDDVVGDGIKIPQNDKAPNCCETPIFLYIIFPVIGWAVPLVMTMAFSIHGLLGYTEHFNLGN
jgi:hypothetical protein